MNIDKKIFKSRQIENNRNKKNSLNNIRIKIILTSIVLILSIFLIFLGFKTINLYINKTNFEEDAISFAEKNENSIFLIEEITLFSSADSKNKTSSENHFTIQNLYQYTDIAFFIKSSEEIKTAKNTLKNVYIDNISITNIESGTPNLYFKPLNEFTKGAIIEENKIEERLNFEVTSSDTNELLLPVLYNNLANPITLSYINENIKTDYTLTNTSIPITYDGSLLERCQIAISSITPKISFDIHLTNNLDEEYMTSIYINIPLENELDSIYKGNTQSKLKTNYTFYRDN